MAFCVVAGVTVDLTVEDDGAGVDEEPFAGDFQRAFDGSGTSGVRGYKRTWSLRTIKTTRAVADTLITALKGTPPLACSGDLFGGAVSCYLLSLSASFPKAGSTERSEVRFRLTEQ